MAELTPVGPSPVVSNVRKVKRDEKLKNKKDKEQQQSTDDISTDEQNKNQRPAQHIDEIV